MTRIGRTAALAAGMVGLTTGCETMSSTTKGAGIGTAIGAGLGTAVGAATGNPKTGAVVGGLLGAGTGAAIGNEMDREDREKSEIRQTQATIAQAEAQAQTSRLGMIDVVQLVQQGQSEAVVINQIHSTGSTFQLSNNDLAYLKSCNVPDGVIVAMQNARPRPAVVAPARPQTVIIREQPSVIYADPWGPPPPVIGFHYRRGRW
jgi:uncharacterized protein YcfJ